MSVESIAMTHTTSDAKTSHSSVPAEQRPDRRGAEQRERPRPAQQLRRRRRTPRAGRGSLASFATTNAARETGFVSTSIAVPARFSAETMPAEAMMTANSTICERFFIHCTYESTYVTGFGHLDHDAGACPPPTDFRI